MRHVKSMRTSVAPVLAPGLCCLVLGCGSVADPGGAEATEPLDQSRSMIQNGTPIPAGSQFADDVVWTTGNPNNNPTCSGTLLTNNWVLTASHCRGTDRRVMLTPPVYCSNPNTTDICPRGTICTDARGWGYVCGVYVKAQYDNPHAADSAINQVDLWQLDRPILSGVSPVPYSIAQQIWYGTKNSLLNRMIYIVGGSGTMPIMQFGAFTISSFQTWSYLVTGVGSYGLDHGDSGGPGYYDESGVHYLTGVTVTSNSQHDLVETWTGGTMPGWIDDTMFSAPQLMQSGVQGLALASTATGAVQTFVRNGAYYFSQCDQEPCDSRASWSTPGWFKSGPTAAPAIAVDNFAGWGPGAQVFIGDSSGITAYANVKGAFLGTTALGGVCTSPAGADSRPGTNPPTLDVLCRGTDGAAWINQRENGNWNGFYSLGKPSAGIRSGAAPAVASVDWNTTYVAVAGADGNVYIQPGQGGVGWTGWTSLGNPWGRSLRSVALASYAPERLDVIAVDSNGRLWHRIGTGNTLARNWSSTWTEITRRTWSSSVPPFAASYGFKYGLLSVGGIGSDGNAYLQRYSDW